MCGIAGFWSAKDTAEPAVVLAEMTDALAHRGPDDQGVWFDPATGVGLGHRRLSILDLSQEGHQPMFSATGRYAIVFNGEVYNFKEIRSRLHHQRWKGNSDTEVMLAAIEEWGLEGAITRFIGMFAFALWDRHEKQLHLVRDRVGIKPLYFGCSKGVLFFGSELKALQAHPDFTAEIDRSSIAQMLRYSYIPAPQAIFAKTYKLSPGNIATFISPTSDPAMKQYWSVQQVASDGANQQFAGEEHECLSRLDALLRDAIKLRMIADVPVGAFLSGGIDSSLVVALMQSVSNRSVRTYSIGFDDPSYNEAHHAKVVAEHLGTSHNELFLTPEEALQSIPDLPAYYDEPFADASQLPTLLVSKLARTEVTVALSGDGGDELFGGYTRHMWLAKIAKINRVVPSFARAVLCRRLGQATGDWELSGRVISYLPPLLRIRNIGAKTSKLVPLLLLNDTDEMYDRVITTWCDATEVVCGAGEARPVFRSLSENALDTFSNVMLKDLVGYLPDGVLTKVDRASMAVALEARVPLLDHRVVEFAWSIPVQWKIRSGKGKWLLRKLLSKYVPTRLFERPKSGFGVPIGTWLRGPLREWASDLLNENKLRREGFLNARRVTAVWNAHLNGHGDWQQHLWCVLMFEAWLQKQTERAFARGQSRTGPTRQIVSAS